MTQRFGIINLDDLGAMEVVETVSSEAILKARMDLFKARWTENDPPLGAAYDVEGLEFDPIKITQEVGASFETNLRARINQTARDTTLAFGFGTNLDGIASRYPGGVPRLPDEADERYRRRIWLSANAFSTAGAEEAYVFYALTAVPTLRDATATVVRTEDGPTVIVTVMREGTDPNPTAEELIAVRKALYQPGVKPLTVPVNIARPRILRTKIEADVWMRPNASQPIVEAGLDAALAAFREERRWLGEDATQLGLMGALPRADVHSAVVHSPIGDLSADPRTLILVESADIKIRGRRS